MFTAAESSEENYTGNTTARLPPVSLQTLVVAKNRDRRDELVSGLYVRIGFYFCFCKFFSQL